MEYVSYSRQADLHDPIAVVAFSGWNDAASAATNAARWLVRRMGARKFATMDADPFYDFRETRPNVRIDLRGSRDISWPANEFFFARNPNGPHDVLVFIGIEPNLRWRTYSGELEEVFKDHGCSLVVSLGALLADVPHSRAVRVTGTANDPESGGRLGLTTSRYEGPTGIVGTLHDSLRKSGVTAASLWANVPHYITTSQNPPATLALLERLQQIIGMNFDFSELQSAGMRFVAEVNTAVEANSEVAAYVKRLEEAYDQGLGDDESRPSEPLPSAQDLILDIEELLRQNRDDD